MEKTDYGSYVQHGFIVMALASGIAALGLSRYLKRRTSKIILWIAGGLSLIASIFMLYMEFATRDSRKLNTRDALLELLPWEGEGKALDIGTGSGLLAIGLAKKFPHAHVVGTDVWKWTAGSGLTKERSKKNAEAEGVGERVSFQHADAREQPFEDSSFDAVLTNLVWHNIPVKDRFNLVAEALRTLKPGGAFMFSDLFKSRFAYGDFTKLKEKLENEVSSCSVMAAPEIEDSKLILSGKVCVFYGHK